MKTQYIRASDNIFGYSPLDESVQTVDISNCANMYAWNQVANAKSRPKEYNLNSIRQKIAEQTGYVNSTLRKIYCYIGHDDSWVEFYITNDSFHSKRVPHNSVPKVVRMTQLLGV